MPNALDERIAEILEDHPELSQTELGKAAGVSKGLVSQWLKGLRKSMSYHSATRLHVAYGYSVDWLINGDGEKLASSKTVKTQDGTNAERLLELFSGLTAKQQEECLKQVMKDVATNQQVLAELPRAPLNVRVHKTGRREAGRSIRKRRRA